MSTLTCEIPEALYVALERRIGATGESTSTFVGRLVQRALNKPLHTLFQISTSRALVQGVYGQAVSSSRLLCHRDFGLGTFDELDGEMIILDGVVYQVRSDGAVRQVAGDVGTPFATVLTFTADGEKSLEHVKSLDHLCLACDKERLSENLFYAFRSDGVFEHVHTRAMRRTQSGISLKTAASVQPEFQFSNIDGTLVGFWFLRLPAPLTSPAIISTSSPPTAQRAGIFSTVLLAASDFDGRESWIFISPCLTPKNSCVQI